MGALQLRSPRLLATTRTWVGGWRGIPGGFPCRFCLEHSCLGLPCHLVALGAGMHLGREMGKDVGGSWNRLCSPSPDALECGSHGPASSPKCSPKRPSPEQGAGGGDSQDSIEQCVLVLCHFVKGGFTSRLPVSIPVAGKECSWPQASTAGVHSLTASPLHPHHLNSFEPWRSSEVSLNSKLEGPSLHWAPEVVGRSFRWFLLTECAGATC